MVVGGWCAGAVVVVTVAVSRCFPRAKTSLAVWALGKERRLLHSLLTSPLFNLVLDLATMSSLRLGSELPCYYLRIRN